MRNRRRTTSDWRSKVQDLYLAWARLEAERNPKQFGHALEPKRLWFTIWRLYTEYTLPIRRYR